MHALNRLAWAVALSLLALLCASAFYAHANASSQGTDVRITTHYRHCVTEDDYAHVRLVAFERGRITTHITYRCVAY